MAMPIDPKTAIAPLREALTKVGQVPGKSDDKNGFMAAMQDALGSTLQRSAEAGQAATQLAKGGDVDLHDTLLAMEKGDVSLKFMVSVRNKVLDAYREIMRMGG
jgi:flagellar hook-basal body complex protein FliE